MDATVWWEKCVDVMNIVVAWFCGRSVRSIRDFGPRTTKASRKEGSGSKLAALDLSGHVFHLGEAAGRCEVWWGRKSWSKQ